MQSDYGGYFSVALLALGLTYLFSTEWEKINGSREAVFAWPKRLVKLGGVSMFCGGALIFVISITAGALQTSPDLYSTGVSAGIGISLPGMFSLAAGFVLGQRRT